VRTQGRPNDACRSARHSGGLTHLRWVPRAGAPVLLAALLAGCASMAPPYERPAAPVAATFPEAAAAGTPAIVPAAEIEWQRFFVDPRLKRLIELALQNNRDLRIAVLNIERVRAQYQIQRSEQLPTVVLGATALGEPDSNGSGTTSYYTAGLNITGYELDLFGRVRSLTDAALQQYFASEEARKAAQISLVATVANTYLTLLADELQLEVTRKTLDTRLESYRLLKLKLDNGATS
jgi:outer membrane protein, multidrug efflux system